MKRTNYLIPLLLAALIVGLIVMDCRRKPAHKEAQPSVTLRGEALGTFYQVTAVGSLPENFPKRLDSLFDAANASMSIFAEGSLLSRINRGETTTADEHIAYCVRLAQGVSRISDGAYDITIKPLVEAFGFAGKDPNYKVNIDSLLSFVGYEKLSVEGTTIRKSDPRVKIDLNSIAKGYTVDLAAALVESTGCTDYLVDIGGEIFCRGTNPYGEAWGVGIETPFEGNFSLTGEHITTVVRVSEVGMATSGNYRNFRTDSEGNKYTHIINPRTGESTTSSLLSATVLADNCALADAYGTMFISLGKERSFEVAEREQIAALFIYDDGGKMRVHKSSTFESKIQNSKLKTER
ncbi:MAG: FAD:protein FMN transferase [Tidjanibacter sp.]|nr:FAD:protein FMN transferase [Tidjanibacter sp.]